MSWIIAFGDGYSFSVQRDPAGPFPTAGAALDRVLEHLLADRRELGAAIARARRLKRRARP